MSTKRTRGGGGAAAAAGRRPRNSPKWYEDDWPGPSGKVMRSQDDFEADGFESDGFEVEMDADDAESADAVETSSAEEEDDESLLDDRVATSKKKTNKEKGKGKAKGKGKKGKPANYGDCTVSVQVGSREKQEVKHLSGKFNNVHEPNFEEFAKEVFELADDMAQQYDEYDDEYDGVLYYRDRTGTGGRKGRTMYELADQRALAAACKKAHRSAGDKVIRDAGEIHCTVKYEAKKVEKGPAKSKKKAKDDGTTPDMRTIVGFLRGPVMRSPKDGSYGTVDYEAGTFGTKVIGQPKTIEFDVNPQTSTAEGSLYDAIEELARDIIGSTAATLDSSAAAAASSPQHCYDNVSVSGMLFACRNTKLPATRLINSAQLLDDFVGRRKDAQKEYKLFLSVGAAPDWEYAVSTEGEPEHATDEIAFSQGATMKNLPPVLVSKEKRKALAEGRSTASKQLLRWTNWHRSKLGVQDELRFKEEHYVALSQAIVEEELEAPADR